MKIKKIILTIVFAIVLCSPIYANEYSDNTPQDVIDMIYSLNDINWNVDGYLKYIKPTKVIDVSWNPSYEKQIEIYKNAKTKKNNYFFMLTLYLLEGSKDNQLATHVNSNGTIDRGHYQLNDCNVWVLKKLGYEEDVNLFFDSDINMQSANYLVKYNKNNYKNIDNYFTEFMNYTGGNSVLTDFMQNGYDENNERMVKAYDYAMKGVYYMSMLYQLYHGLI